MQISSINIDNILSGNHDDRILELQSLLDPVTFCLFSAADVRNNTVDAVAKLVFFMQLLLEYLLHCQESQYKLIKDSNHKLAKLKLQSDKLRRDNAAMKEDIKIYRRQLNLLKHSLSKSQGSAIENDFSSKQLPKVVITPHLYNNKSNAQSKDELVESILHHEKETRAVMASILDEQREMFLKQMSLLSDSIKRYSNPPKFDEFSNEKERNIERLVSNNTALLIDRFKEEMQTMLNSVTSVINFNRAPVISNDMGTGTLSVIQEVRNKEAQIIERELQLKIIELSEREEQLKRRMESLQSDPNTQKPSIVHSPHTTSVIPISTASKRSREDSDIRSESNQVTHHKAGAIIINSTIRKVAARMQGRAFYVWRRESLSAIEDQRSFLQQRAAALQQQLQEMESKVQRLRELERSLASEREKSFIALSRQHALEREVEALRGQLTESQSGAEDSRSREKELLASLRAEKEKAFVAAARYNALMSKTEKDRAVWEERIRMAEELLAKHAAEPSNDTRPNRHYSDSSVMTSLEQLPRASAARQASVQTSVQGSSSASTEFRQMQSPLFDSNTSDNLMLKRPATDSALFNAEISPVKYSANEGKIEEQNRLYKDILLTTGNEAWLRDDLDEGQLMLAVEKRVKESIPDRISLLDMESAVMNSVLKELF